MKRIILENGQVIDLATWQEGRGLPADKLSKNFQVAEFVDVNDGSLLISEVLIDFLQVLRDKTGTPVKVSYKGGYRTESTQKGMQATNSNAATNSPHVKGMAGDVDRPTIKSTREFAKLALETAKEIGIGIRVGYLDYLSKGQSFVHIDVCPEYYGMDGPYVPSKFPAAWSIPYLTW